MIQSQIKQSQCKLTFILDRICIFCQTIPIICQKVKHQPTSVPGVESDYLMQLKLPHQTKESVSTVNAYAHILNEWFILMGH